MSAVVGTRAVLVARAVRVAWRRASVLVAVVARGNQRVGRAQSIALMVHHAVAKHPEGRFDERTGHQQNQHQGDAAVSQQGTDSRSARAPAGAGIQVTIMADRPALSMPKRPPVLSRLDCKLAVQRICSGMSIQGLNRSALVRRGLVLNYLTIGYNAVEAVISIVAGLAAGSVVLVGFGVDSAIEVTASGAAHWRLRTDHQAARRAHVERQAGQVIGWSFLGLALYIGWDAVAALIARETPHPSVVGLIILTLSVVVMPVLSRHKRDVARALSSQALAADAKQTALCAYLSVIALVGVGLNALLGWWWADPISALAMVPIILREGCDGVRGRACDRC